MRSKWVARGGIHKIWHKIWERRTAAQCEPRPSLKGRARRCRKNNAWGKGCLRLWCPVEFLLAGLCAQGVRTGVLQHWQEAKSGLWCGTVLTPVRLLLFPGRWTICWIILLGLFPDGRGFLDNCCLIQVALLSAF
eukprot:1118144-Pelagomonas_calceolata.AAC.1